MTLRILLTEGERDAAFLAALCREFDIPNVDVRPPSQVGGAGDGWGNTLELARALALSMPDGHVVNLAVVVDADYANYDGRGRVRVNSEYREMLAELGYQRNPRQIGTGAIFAHSDGLPSVGVWVMPDNQNDGMLEDFLALTVGANSRALFDHGRSTVQSLPNPLFNRARHGAKAVVSTWLSWQRMPGKHIVSAVGEGLLDLQSTPMQQLSLWLKSAFE